MDSQSILRLFQNVFDNEVKDNKISPEAIKLAIECMAHVYRPTTSSLKSERSLIADFTDIAHRTAYLHKYAAFHTAMVRDMMHDAIEANFDFFYSLIFSGDQFKICSLGGGPGSDIIGALIALHGAFSYCETSVTVIDYMADWSYSFASILKELGSGLYGAFGNNTSYFLNWQYIGANLLKPFTPEVIEALSSASLVTMVKFASATSCQDTKLMIQNIFAAMKPGAVVLFIDNGGGGFHHLMMDAASKFNFIPVVRPLKQELYINEQTKAKIFGYKSCYQTTVTVLILLKPVMGEPYNNICDSFVQNQAHPLPQSTATPVLYRNETYFAQDVVMNQDGFQSSPEEEIPQSPRSSIPSVVTTPLTKDIVNLPYPTYHIESNQSRHTGSKSHRPGCLPFKINNFRHHLSRKVNQFKRNARAMFTKQMKKNAHPVFNL